MEAIDSGVMREICDELPMGFFLLNDEKEIYFWNHWLVEKTGITVEQALTSTLPQLIPDVDSRRFDWAVEEVLKNNIPQVMSNALNEYLLPIHLENSAYDEIQHMQQQIKIIPIERDGNRYAAVMISDITDSVLQKQTLIKMAVRLEQDSFHDPLTNAYNRRYMWNWLEKNMHLGAREGFTIGCCAFDLDNFKKVNDVYGHDRGDQVLVSFSKLLMDSKRASSLIVRIGGEEFAALLPMASLRDTILYAHRVKVTLCEQSIAGFEVGEITTSMGCSVWMPTDAVSCDELLKSADELLYLAKGAGRNCVKPDLT